MTGKGFPVVPAAFFGIVLGVVGLGGTWRAAHLAWGLPAMVGEILMCAGAVIWLLLILCYAAKWFVAPEAARAELAHPVQCCFVGLVGVATMLVAGGAAPYSHGTALVLYAAGAFFTFAFAIWRTGALWKGERDPAQTTPVLYLPTVAGSFVAGTVGAGLGLRDLGGFFFGMGFFAWLAIESVLLHRLLTAPALAAALRPTLGVQLAPPVVGAVTLISVAPEVAPIFVHAMLGYGILQALILVRLLPWIMEEPFTPSYWAFTFGATALATVPVRLLLVNDDGAIRYLAPVLFGFANIVVAIVAFGTVMRMLQGRLLPPISPLPHPR